MILERPLTVGGLDAFLVRVSSNSKFKVPVHNLWGGLLGRSSCCRHPLGSKGSLLGSRVLEVGYMREVVAIEVEAFFLIASMTQQK